MRQIEIGGLPERDAARLVGLRAGASAPEEFSHALYEETEGNPFFIEEIIRHLEDSGVEHGARALTTCSGLGCLTTSAR